MILYYILHFCIQILAGVPWSDSELSMTPVCSPRNRHRKQKYSTGIDRIYLITIDSLIYMHIAHTAKYSSAKAQTAGERQSNGELLVCTWFNGKMDFVAFGFISTCIQTIPWMNPVIRHPQS